jgi:hypothetical protein
MVNFQFQFQKKYCSSTQRRPDISKTSLRKKYPRMANQKKKNSNYGPRLAGPFFLLPVPAGPPGFIQVLKSLGVLKKKQNRLRADVSPFFHNPNFARHTKFKFFYLKMPKLSPNSQIFPKSSKLVFKLKKKQPSWRHDSRRTHRGLMVGCWRSKLIATANALA